MENRLSKLRILAGSVGIIAACTGILFFPYLLGEKLFLFPHVISDGVVQFYPQYYQLAEMLEKGQGFATYVFSSGWGNYIYISDIFELFIVMGGTQQIAYRVGIVIVCKVILSGAIFSTYLYYSGKHSTTSIIGGLTYGFSAQVLIGGIWKNQGELAIIMALALLVIAVWKKGKSIRNVILTIFALAMYATQISIYYQLVYGVVIVGCIFVSYLLKERKQHSEKKAKNKKVWIVLGVAIIVVAIILCWYIMPQMVSVFQSYRVQSGLAQWTEKWKDTFTIHNIKECITVYLRTLSPSILGVSGIEMWYGEGPGAYCEAGSYYCGLLILLMVPQAYGKDKKRNIIYSLLLAGVAVLTFFPAIRLVANGFANTYFKLTRMLGMLVVLWIGIQGLQKIVDNRKNLKVKRLWITVGVILTPMLLLAVWKYRGKIYTQDMIIVSVFMLLYGVILTFYRVNQKQEKKLKYILIVLVAIESVGINYRFINNADAVTKEEWDTAYYQDGTIEAVNEIEEKDDDFFRIEKGYRSGLLDDAGVQGYHGTTYYIGGVGNRPQTELMVNLGMPALWNQRGYCGGAYGNAAAEVLFADRYALARYDECISYNYQKVDTVDQVHIFENKDAFSIGFAYDTVISQEEFEKSDYQDRRDIILQSCVVENDSPLLEDIGEADVLQTTDIEPIRYIELENYQLNTGINVETIQKNETVVVELENAKEECLNVVWSTPKEAWQKNRERIVSIYEEMGKNELVLNNQEGTTMFIIQPFSTTELTTVDKVAIKVYDTDEYYKVYEQSVAKLHKNELWLEEWSDTSMKGSITVDSKKLLYLSIPYNKKWTYLADGEKVQAERVNYAFTGIVLEPGEHEVEVQFRK